MESKDLRIGNKLQKDNGDVFTVLRLDNTSDVLVSEERCLLSLNYNLKGISLNENWLLRFGFEKKSWKSEGIVIECFYYEKNGIVVYLIASGFEIEIKHREDQFNLFKVWQYVHELQNLYWIFKNQELIIEN